MLNLVVPLLLYAGMNLYIYKYMSRAFSLSDEHKRVFILFLAVMGGLHFFGCFLRIMFSFDVYLLRYAGLIWSWGTRFLFVLCFLHMGLSLVFESKKKWWHIGGLILFLLDLVLLLVVFPYGRPVADYIYLTSPLVRIAIFFLINLIIYKIITVSLDAKDKMKGWLLILFSSGGVMILTGIGFGLIPVLIGFFGIIYARVAGGLNLSKRVRRFILGIMTVGFVTSIPQMTFWGNGIGIDWLYFASGVWYGLMVMGFAIFALESAFLLFTRAHQKPRVAIFLVILLLAAGYSIYNGQQVPTVKRLTVEMEHLPEHLNGFTIAHLSDLHLGDMVSSNWLEKTMIKTNGLKPDIIVITGDLIDKGIGDGSAYTKSLAKLNAQYGVFAVSGNHEYYNYRFPVFLKIAKQTGIRVLQNENVMIADGIQLAGVNDETAGGYNSEDNDLPKALKGIDLEKPVILLVHQPFYTVPAKSQGVDLQLSGHTHAGQIPPMSIINYFVYRYPHGLYKEGEYYIHTSGGTGLWGVPMRLCSSNEIALITLVKKKKQAAKNK